MQKRGPQTFYVTTTLHAVVPIERPLNADGTPKRTKVTVNSPYTQTSPKWESDFKAALDQSLGTLEKALREEDCPDLDSQMTGARRFADLILSVAVSNLSASIVID